MPATADLPRLSQTVWNNLRRRQIDESLQPPRPGQPARAVPERIGEPSRIRYVVYIIKENRTFDQVLGDLPQANGDSALCVFGRRITPNQHKVVCDFTLLDNTYCAGILSADGHVWSMAAFVNDYLERSFANFPRSYPDGMGEDESDALAWSPAGFLWDRAFVQGVSLRNYGEFTGPTVRWRDSNNKTQLDFRACYAAWQKKRDDVIFECQATIPTLRNVSPTNYVGWCLDVPDQYRADVILRELRDFEARGQFPSLVLICLPNDHTSGTKPGLPTPAAMAADNDLAFGRIVEGLSHSRFWKEMAIAAIEDDPQDGWDHVSGYRTTAYVISPFVRRKAVVSPIQHREPAPHNRTDLGTQAHEPVRRRGSSDVRMFHGNPRLHPLRRPAQQRAAGPGESRTAHHLQPAVAGRRLGFAAVPIRPARPGA